MSNVKQVNINCRPPSVRKRNLSSTTPQSSWISVRSGILHLPVEISRVVFLFDCGCLCRLEKGNTANVKYVRKI